METVTWYNMLQDINVMCVQRLTTLVTETSVYVAGILNEIQTPYFCNIFLERYCYFHHYVHR
jgi:hypothetical protein